MLDRKIFENLRVPGLPANDLAPLNNAELSREYDELTSAIHKQDADVTTYLKRGVAVANGTSTDSRALEKELSALRSEALLLGVAGVSLAQQRHNLKNQLRQVHRQHQIKMENVLQSATEAKKVELRELCGGELPYGWDSTVAQALHREHMAAGWRPVLAMEGYFHPADEPETKAQRTLRAVIVASLGFDPSAS